MLNYIAKLKDETAEFNRVWDWQRTVPVVLRNRQGRLLIRLPYAADNRAWLVDGRRDSTKWDKQEKYWTVPAAWLNKFVRLALIRYGQLYIIQPYREKEVCAPACWNAEGHDCQCSCMGMHHGMGRQNGYFVVNETFAVKWGPERMACRLVRTRGLNPPSPLGT